jgi:hypothetical protein
MLQRYILPPSPASKWKKKKKTATNGAQLDACFCYFLGWLTP